MPKIGEKGSVDGHSFVWKRGKNTNALVRDFTSKKAEPKVRPKAKPKTTAAPVKVKAGASNPPAQPKTPTYNNGPRFSGKDGQIVRAQPTQPKTPGRDKVPTTSETSTRKVKPATSKDGQIVRVQPKKPQEPKGTPRPTLKSKTDSDIVRAQPKKPKAPTRDKAPASKSKSSVAKWRKKMGAQ